MCDNVRVAGKTALVLSAGGMFGAYQAGAWEVLAPVFRPDLVVGASVGAVNGWQIACGCQAAELVRRWLNLDALARLRWRLRWNPLAGGVVDAGPLERMLRDVAAEGPPRMPYAAVVTELARLRPCLIDGAQVDWRHLAASCAVLGLLPQPLIDGRRYTDGGLMGALPLWAAVELGATRIVAVHVLPRMSWPIRAAVAALRGLSRHRPRTPSGVEVLLIAPAGPLGTLRDASVWSRENARRWIEQGRRDAAETASWRDTPWRDTPWRGIA